MSKVTLLFSLVAAVTGVHLQVGQNSTIIVKTELIIGMDIVFEVDGSSNIRFDFLTDDCAKIMRLDFQPNQNNIAMNTFDGQRWAEKEFATYQFQSTTNVTIRVARESFDIYIGTRSDAVTQYKHRLPLTSITQVRLNGGESNEVLDFFMVDNNGERLKILDEWMNPGPSWINFFGIPTGSFTIDLLANLTVALRMSFNDSYIGRNSRIAGQAWDPEETDGEFALQPGKMIGVHILVTENRYIMKVNGVVIGTYTYRVNNPRSVNGMRVEGLPGVYIVYLTDPQETAESIPCKVKGNEYVI